MDFLLFRVSDRFHGEAGQRFFFQRFGMDFKLTLNRIFGFRSGITCHQDASSGERDD